MIVDEKGLLKNKPMNPLASGIANDYIVGIAVICQEKLLNL